NSLYITKADASSGGVARIRVPRETCGLSIFKNIIIFHSKHVRANPLIVPIRVAAAVAAATAVTVVVDCPRPQGRDGYRQEHHWRVGVRTSSIPRQPSTQSFKLQIRRVTGARVLVNPIRYEGYRTLRR